MLQVTLALLCAHSQTDIAVASAVYYGESKSKEGPISASPYIQLKRTSAWAGLKAATGAQAQTFPYERCQDYIIYQNNLTEGEAENGTWKMLNRDVHGAIPIAWQGKQHVVAELSCHQMVD